MPKLKVESTHPLAEIGRPLDIISEAVEILSQIQAPRQTPPSVLLFLGLYHTQQSGKCIAMPWSEESFLPKRDFPLRYCTADTTEAPFSVILKIIDAALSSVEQQRRKQLKKHHTFRGRRDEEKWTTAQFCSHLQVSKDNDRLILG
jgi:hypothetical protein